MQAEEAQTRRKTNRCLVGTERALAKWGVVRYQLRECGIAITEQRDETEKREEEG